MLACCGEGVWRINPSSFSTRDIPTQPTAEEISGLSTTSICLGHLLHVNRTIHFSPHKINNAAGSLGEFKSKRSLQQGRFKTGYHSHYKNKNRKTDEMRQLQLRQSGSTFLVSFTITSIVSSSASVSIDILWKTNPQAFPESQRSAQIVVSGRNKELSTSVMRKKRHFTREAGELWKITCF